MHIAGPDSTRTHPGEEIQTKIEGAPTRLPAVAGDLYMAAIRVFALIVTLLLKKTSKR